MPTWRWWQAERCFPDSLQLYRHKGWLLRPETSDQSDDSTGCEWLTPWPTQFNIILKVQPPKFELWQSFPDTLPDVDCRLCRYSKYANFPSCSESDWATRYWRNYTQENWQKLKKELIFSQLEDIKKAWDPTNTFHHCQVSRISDHTRKRSWRS